MKIHPFGVTVLHGVLLSLSFGASAAVFDNIYVFGDSLSDQGNVSLLTSGAIPGSDYFNGRFSNGPIYVDGLAQGLGLAVSQLAAPMLSPPFPAWSPGGGNNFAYGGARTDSHRSGLPLGLDSQVAAFANGAPAADADALYVVFAGANDVQDAIGIANDSPTEVAAAMTDPLVAFGAVENAAQNVASAIRDLAATGARHFFVPNGPDWALVPAVIEMESGHAGLAGFGDFARDVSLAFNDRLAVELNAIGLASPAIDILSFDFSALLREMVDNPALYGFTNISMSCYDGDDLGFSGGGSVCTHPDEYLFWDRIHPTAAAHAVLASRFLAAIPEPASLLLFVLGVSVLLLIMRRHDRSVCPLRRVALGPGHASMS